MYLSKLILDTRDARVRRDLSDAYEMHRTLARAFTPDADTPPARFLWRLERPATFQSTAVLLVQSPEPADWAALGTWAGYTVEAPGNKPVDLGKLIQPDACYRFRLLANPTVTRAGKRHGLLREEEQLAWLDRQGERHGFTVLACARGVSERLQARQARAGRRILLDSALFEGLLQAMAPGALEQAVVHGLGHGKAFGLGMLSLARIGQLESTLRLGPTISP